MNYLFSILLFLIATLLTIQLFQNDFFDENSEIPDGYEIQKISCVENFSLDKSNKELNGGG